MSPPDEPDTTLVRFLLGDLGESDRARIEERLFSDASLRDTLESATDDLVEDYLGGALSAADRARFESHFLAAQRHRRRLRVVTLLTATASRARPAAPSMAPGSGRPIAFWALAAGLALTVAGVIGVALFQAAGRRQQAAVAPSPSPSPRQAPATPSTGAGPDATPTPLQTPRLASAEGEAAVRTVHLGVAARHPIVVAVSPSTRRVQLQLPVEVKAPTYEAVIRTVEGREVWRAQDLAREDGSLSITVPAEALEGGDYVLVVTGEVFRSPERPRIERRLRVVRQAP
jgi:hypothetical protein